jgi:TRAP-type uncharacterized transport system fused permease subunit
VLILVEATPLLILQMLATSVMGMVALAAGIAGFWTVNLLPIERIALIVGGLLLVDPGPITDLCGAGMVGSIYLVQRIRASRAAKALQD